MSIPTTRVLFIGGVCDGEWCDVPDIDVRMGRVRRYRRSQDDVFRLEQSDYTRQTVVACAWNHQEHSYLFVCDDISVEDAFMRLVNNYRPVTYKGG